MLTRHCLCAFLPHCGISWKPREAVDPSQVRLAMGPWSRDTFAPGVESEVEVLLNIRLRAFSFAGGQQELRSPEYIVPHAGIDAIVCQ